VSQDLVTLATGSKLSRLESKVKFNQPKFGLFCIKLIFSTERIFAFSSAFVENPFLGAPLTHSLLSRVSIPKFGSVAIETAFGLNESPYAKKGISFRLTMTAFCGILTISNGRNAAKIGTRRKRSLTTEYV